MELRDEAVKSVNQLAEERTELAVTRTIMAADRSLMAWVRTALAMIGVSVTLYKLLQGLQESSQFGEQLSQAQGIGLFLSGLAVLSMVMGSIEYWSTLREMRVFRPVPFLRPVSAIALIMGLTGVLVFVSILYQLI